MTSADGWLGLEASGPGGWAFELTPPLGRFDGKLYGGTGLAAVTAAMEAETGRATLWASVQFVASADVGERIECHVEVLAQGRRTSQLRVTAHAGDRLVLAALGATGTPRTGGLEVQIGAMPEVAPPDASPPWAPKMPFAITEENQGWLALVEMREVRGPGEGMALWGRIRDEPQTRAAMGFLADLVPSAVVRARGAGRGWNQPGQCHPLRSRTRDRLDPHRSRPVLRRWWLRARGGALVVPRRLAAGRRQPDGRRPHRRLTGPA